MSKRKPGKDTRPATAPASHAKGAAPVKEMEKKKTGKTIASSLVHKMAAFIFLLAFLLYFQTNKYSFTLDDRLVVFENQLTTKGISAIPEIFSKPYLSGSIVPDDKIYRPMSKAVFAICWSLSPNNPTLFHLVNIFLYALTGLLLFLVLVKFFPGKILLPFVISLLFVAHPVHTEVVCSIKSLDEILCLLFFIISLHFIYAYLQTEKIVSLALAAICFFFAFLSKESGLTFLAVFPLIAFLGGANQKKLLSVSGAMMFVAILVFGIRAMILSGDSVNPVLESDNILAGTDNMLIQKMTAIYLLGKYLLLLIFPHPLVCDYSIRQVELVNPGNIYFLLSLAVLTGALIYAFIRFAKKDWLAFAILFFFITFSVTCNIFFLSGSHFAERFLYTPSLGFCIAVTILLDRFVETKKKTGETFPAIFTGRPVFMSIVFVIVLLYSFKTIQQSPVWKDNISLFENGVKYSPKSYRMHLSLAQDLADEKHIKQFTPQVQAQLYERAINETKTSLLYYRDIDAYDIMGNVYYLTNRYDTALYYYQEGLKMIPDYETLNYHAGKALDKLNRFREAIPYLNKALQKNPKNDGVLYNLALSYTNMNEIDQGLDYFLRVLEINPNKLEALHYTAEIYKAKGDMAKYEEYKQKENNLGGMKSP